MFDLPFKSNYPNYSSSEVTLRPTPARVGATGDYTGQGVTIAFVDSGFSMHPDISDRVMTYIDASTNHVTEHDHVDHVSVMSWHGQMTSVIAAGDGRTSNGKYRGIAFDSQLVLIKVSTPDFRLKETDILRGLQWIYDTRHRHQIRVVNVSVGGDYPSDDPDHPLHRIVRKLHEIGIVVVIAAGNSGRPSLLPPASASHGIVVGGYDDQNNSDRTRWTLYHHSYGQAYNATTKPDVLSLASWVIAPLLPESDVETEAHWLAQLLRVQTRTDLQTILEASYQDLDLSHSEILSMSYKLYQKLQDKINQHKLVDAHHQHVDGTSVAVPIVASVVAQMLEANPKLTPDQVCHILTDTARALPGFPDELQGAGVLNARHAVETARLF